jgi:hypothetical protein
MLWRLLGVDRKPCQSRTVVRRYEDGRPLLRLHHRQPLFHKTVGIFDDEDHRIGYVQWSVKGGGPCDEFDLVRVDHRRFAEVRRRTADEYRVAESKDGRAWATVTVSHSDGNPRTPAVCRIALNEAAFDCEMDGLFVVAAGLVLFRPE